MNVNSHTLDAVSSPELLVPSGLRIGELRNRPSTSGQNVQHARTKQVSEATPDDVTPLPYQPRPETQPDSPRPVGIALSLFPAQRSPNSTRLKSSKLETPGTILSSLRSEHCKILKESAPHHDRTGKYLHVDFLTQVEHAEPRPTHPRRNGSDTDLSLSRTAHNQQLAQIQHARYNFEQSKVLFLTTKRYSSGLCSIRIFRKKSP
jgi:hypothetical protein